ncbi:hypothetical protein [Maridesulfovibrio sp.]|uniref:hypothetical protein n=1 Tax=Maridesulfovibrio sp. TaxID=2795000 RepID=UPI003AFFC65B
MDKTGEWTFSPAYDLAYSYGPNGEQSTMVMGEGRNPGEKHLLALATVANVNEKKAQQIIEQVRDSLPGLRSWLMSMVFLRG